MLPEQLRVRTYGAEISRSSTEMKQERASLRLLAPRSTQRHGEDSRRHGPVTFLPEDPDRGKTTRTLDGASRRPGVKSPRGGFFFEAAQKTIDYSVATDSIRN